MNGPEHYARAEQLVRQSEESRDAPMVVGQILREAQVHATLALAAATALTGMVHTGAGNTTDAWREAAS